MNNIVTSYYLYRYYSDPSGKEKLDPRASLNHPQDISSQV